jgi:hypothetical protein
LEEQFEHIKQEIMRWWAEATTGGGLPIEAEFQREYNARPQPAFAFEMKSASENGTKLAAGAACAWLSLDTGA